MKKELKDYLHLYLGCIVDVKKKTDDKFHRGKMVEITDGSNHGNWIIVRFDDVITTTSQTWETLSSNQHYFFIGEDSIKPILRPLSDMTTDEAHHLAWLCMDSEYHLEADSRVTKDEVDIDMVLNDGGLNLDDDVEVYINLSVRCFFGAVALRKDGSIVVWDDTLEKETRVDDIADKVRYLLSQKFDLFDLIGSGLAIDKTEIK